MHDNGLTHTRRGIRESVWLCFISAGNIAYGAWALEFTILIFPEESRALFPNHQAIALAGMVMIICAANLFCPIFGNLADSLRTPWGKRRSLLAALMFFVALILTPSLIAAHRLRFPVLYILLLIVHQLVTAAFFQVQIAVVPDIVPKDSQDLACGLASMNILIGAVAAMAFIFCGEKTGDADIVLTKNYIFLSVLTLACMATLLCALMSESRDLKWGFELDAKNGFWAFTMDASGINFLLYERNKYWNFFLVTCERTLYYPLIVSKTFLNFYCFDIYGLENIDELNHFMVWFAFACEGSAAIGALVTAHALDKNIVRKQTAVMSSSVWMALTFALVPFIQASWALRLAVVFGLGNGAFLAADNALSTAAIPDKEKAAYYLGFWGLAGLAGGGLGCMINAAVVELGRALGDLWLGYSGGFWCCCVLSVIGGQIAWRVRLEEDACDELTPLQAKRIKGARPGAP